MILELKSCYFAIHAILLLGIVMVLELEVVLFCYLCYFVVSVRRYASLLLMLFCDF